MKKVIVLLFCSLLIFKNEGSAQNSPNEVVVNGGIGESLIPFFTENLAQSNFDLYNYTTGVVPSITTSATPALSASLDYGIFNEFSVGGGVTYQSCTVNVTNYFSSYKGYENVTENISRLNIRIRIMAHWDFSDSHHWEMYGGLGLGSSIWKDENNANDPGFPCDAGTLWALNTGTTRLYSFQGFLGIRGYFNESVGAHIELAVGSPYFVDAGISFRFGGLPISLRGDE